MRKNGVNRELRQIEGGVCAPAGFKAGGVACGIRRDGKKDLALILSEKRCPTACVYSTSKTTGSPIAVTKKHLRDGHAQAILANGGIANVFLPDGVRFTEDICNLLDRACGVSRDQVVIASTGKIGTVLTKEPFERGVSLFKENLGVGEEYSLAAAQAIASEDEEGKQLAFAFDLGDFPCKIGAVFKGTTQVCPNMATTLVFLTTDVNISPEMLQKALEAETRETINLLDVDGEPSPNDTVCMMANGRAGNCRIEYADSEFKKFSFALRGVLFEICKRIAAGKNGKPFLCTVSGARSKQISRSLAKRLVGNIGIRTALSQGKAPFGYAICALADTGCAGDTGGVSVSVCSDSEELVVYEDGKAFPYAEKSVKKICSAGEIGLLVRLNEGNYSSTAIGCCEKEEKD